ADAHHTRLAAGEFEARLIDDPDVVPWQRTPKGTWADGEKRAAVAGHQVALGLAIELVQVDSEGFARPAQQLFAQCFAATCDRAQLQVCWRSVTLAQHLQGSRRHEDVANTVFGHQGISLVRIEFACPKGQHRDTVMQRGQQDVQQTADPGPVCWGPHEISRLREEIMRQLDSGEMPEKYAMAVQGAFWISSRAGGIDDDRWVVRGAIWPLKAVAGLLQKCIEGEAPGRRT